MKNHSLVMVLLLCLSQLALAAPNQLTSHVLFLRAGEGEYIPSGANEHLATGYYRTLTNYGKSTSEKYASYFEDLAIAKNRFGKPQLFINEKPINGITIYSSWEKDNSQTAVIVGNGINKFANKFKRYPEIERAYSVDTAAIQNRKNGYNVRLNGYLIDNYSGGRNEKNRLDEKVHEAWKNENHLTIFITGKSVINGYLNSIPEIKDSDHGYIYPIEKIFGLVEEDKKNTSTKIKLGRKIFTK